MTFSYYFVIYGFFCFAMQQVSQVHTAPLHIAHFDLFTVSCLHFMFNQVDNANQFPALQQPQMSLPTAAAVECCCNVKRNNYMNNFC